LNSGFDRCHDDVWPLTFSVVSLTLFPSLIGRHAHADQSLLRAVSNDSMPSLDIAPPKSFSGRLVTALADEFDYLLRWELPVSTIVHFNELGKATHVRDSVDLLDLVETFVPFAKRLSWLTRRVTGLVSSTVGSVALAMIPDATKAATKSTKAAPSASKGKQREEIGLGFDLPGAGEELIRIDPHVDEANTLGLEGMAADI
jgi:hypothetical protein